MKDLDHAIAISDQNERVQQISSFLGIGWKCVMDEEQSIVFAKAQTALVAIPGHATYWENQINETRRLVLAHARLSKEEKYELMDNGTHRNLGHYEEIRRQAFESLSLMPSAEAVGVLGRFINDPEGLDGKDMLGNIRGSEDEIPYACNAKAACLGLATLPIENPPVSPDELWVKRGSGWAAPDEDLAKWKAWWNRIASGRGTYRFKGDPTEYGPDGPATPELLEHIRKANERERDRESRRTTPTGASAKDAGTDIGAGGAGPRVTGAPLIGTLTATAAILAALAWYLLRRQTPD